MGRRRRQGALIGEYGRTAAGAYCSGSIGFFSLSRIERGRAKLR